MTEISLYLPVKSILRFRSVSKQWHSLLTHHRFIQCYASHKATNSLLFLDFDFGIKSLHLKGSDNHNLDMADFGYMKNSCQDILSLKSSCNGLLLFNSVVDFTRKFFVCNPSTRKYTELDVPDSIATAQSVFLYLAFDPSKSPYYKVVFFWIEKYFSFGYDIAIYSSETRTCRKLGYTAKTDNMLFYSGAYMNGPIQWARTRQTISSLFYFDINQESIREFQMPPYSSLQEACFGACRGHLHLIFCPIDSRYSRQNVFDVYELDEDGSSWFVKYKVDLDDIAVDFPEIIFCIDGNSKKLYEETSFLCLLDEDEEGPTLILSLPNKFLAYNLMNKTTKIFCDIPYRYRRSIEWNQTFHCSESLSDV